MSTTLRARIADLYHTKPHRGGLQQSAEAEAFRVAAQSGGSSSTFICGAISSSILLSSVFRGVVNSVRHFGSTSMPPLGLRVVTYNTHRFQDKNDKDSTSQIIADLAALKPSIVCLNEVDLRKQPGVLQRIENELGMTSHMFGHVGDGMYGNALISKFPIKQTSIIEVMLEGGTEVEWKGGTYRIQRGMLVAEVEIDSQSGRSIGVACTHLDHIKEEERTIQIGHALRVLGKLQVPHFFMGDFNAMQSDDYSPDQWNGHIKFNDEQGWDPPADSSAEGSSLWYNEFVLHIKLRVLNFSYMSLLTTLPGCWSSSSTRIAFDSSMPLLMARQPNGQRMLVILNTASTIFMPALEWSPRIQKVKHAKLTQKLTSGGSSEVPW